MSVSNASVNASMKGPLKFPQFNANASGEWAKTLVSGNVKLDTRSKAIAGDVFLASKMNDLSLKPTLGSDLRLADVAAKATLGGTLDELSMKGSINFGRLHSDWLTVDRGNAEFSLANNFLRILKGSVKSAQGILRVDSFGLDLKSNKIRGKVIISAVDLFQSFPNSISQSKAVLDAIVTIDGTLKAPRILMEGSVQNPTLLGHSFGDLELVARYGH